MHMCKVNKVIIRENAIVLIGFEEINDVAIFQFINGKIIIYPVNGNNMIITLSKNAFTCDLETNENMEKYTTNKELLNELKENGFGETLYIKINDKYYQC